MILIIGAHKAFALYKAIEEGVNHMWTVSAFQQHPKTLMLCDEDATLELRVKTVKYFKVNISINLSLIQLFYRIWFYIYLIFYISQNLTHVYVTIRLNKSGSMFALTLCTNNMCICVALDACFISFYLNYMYISSQIFSPMSLYWFSGFKWSSS